MTRPSPAVDAGDPHGSSPAPAHSLRRRLVLLLLGCVFTVAAVQAFVAWRAALAQADSSFDYQMRQLALAFRADAVDSADAARQREVEELDFVVQVWTEDGRRLYRSSTRRVVPAAPDPGFSVVQTGESTWRVFSLRNQGRSVQVAQDLQARAAQARSMALASALPILSLMPLLMGMVWWAVTRSLAPVRRVRDQLASRTVSDLTPVSAPGLPAEVAPLVREFNALLQRVHHAFQAQQNFVADAAHELRSPLAALKLQVGNLHAVSSEADRQSALASLDSGVNRAVRMVEQLLALARHDAASDSQTMQHADLAEIVRQTVARMAADADARRVEIGSSGCDPVRVRLWPDAIAILLRNLLDNAIKYTPAGGSVDVSIEPREEGPMLVVEDSGPGIAPTDRERVLDRFYRGPGGRKDQVDIEGSGLGLAIASAIAKRHRAQLRLARSARLGGLRVSVQFQAQDGPDSGPAPR